LIANGGQQAPVNVITGCGFFKGLLIAWQAIVDMVNKGSRAHVVDLFHVAVIALLELKQGAILFDALEELLRQLQQRVVSRDREDPADGARLADVERLADPRIIGLMNGELVRVENSNVDFTFL